MTRGAADAAPMQCCADTAGMLVPADTPAAAGRVARRRSAPFASVAVAVLAAVAVVAALPHLATAATSPSGRVYEQVSAIDKNGSEGYPVFQGSPLMDFAYPFLFTPSGDAVQYGSNGAFADARIGNTNSYLATRGPGGWTTAAISPPSLAVDPLTNSGVQFALDATSDLSHTVFGINYLAGAGGVHSADGFVLSMRGPDGSTTQISRGSLGGTGSGDVRYGGMSADGSKVVFRSAAILEPGAILFPDNGGINLNLYERDLTTGTTQLAGVLPDGTVPPAGAILGRQLPSGAGVQADTPSRTSVSTDGRRVFFTAIDPSDPDTNNGAVFVRVDGVRTLRVSGSPLVPPPLASQGELFQFATPDGAHVWFTSPQSLTADAPADEISLYRYDINDAGTGGQLSFVAGGMPDDGSTGLIGASSDGSVAYFVSEDAIGGAGSAGSPNLYVEDHGVVSFVATLGFSDTVTMNDFTDQQRQAPQARVTPDGRHLLFQTFAGIDPAFDNAGHAEVYDYTLGGGPLRCVSCGPQPASADVALTGPTSTSAMHLSQNITDDGGTVFFETGESLLPQDTNQLLDVYEWQDGQVTLISPGKGGSDAHFVGATADLRNVYLTSLDQLAPSDVDSSGDLYDARVGGGFPTLPPGNGAPCSGDDCRAAATPPPAGLQPGTEADGVAPGQAPAAAVTPATSVAAQVKVTNRQVTGKTLYLSVSVPGRGRISATGSGIAAVHKSVSKRGVYRIGVALTKKERAALKRRHRSSVKVKVTLTFRPSSGKAATTSTTATLKA